MESGLSSPDIIFSEASSYFLASRNVWLVINATCLFLCNILFQIGYLRFRSNNASIYGTVPHSRPGTPLASLKYAVIKHMP